MAAVLLKGYGGFEQLQFRVSYIERNEIRPLIARTFPLRDIVAAQREFLLKRHTGKIVLIP